MHTEAAQAERKIPSSSSPYIEMIGGSILQIHIHVMNRSSVLASSSMHLSSFTQLWHGNTWQKCPPGMQSQSSHGRWRLRQVAPPHTLPAPKLGNLFGGNYLCHMAHAGCRQERRRVQQCAMLHAAHHEVHSVRADVANRQGGGRVNPSQLPLNGCLPRCRIASDARHQSGVAMWTRQRSTPRR